MRGREYPDRPLLGVGAVIVRDDNVVLVRRAHAPRLGEWSIPGGLVELGETLRQAAEREALEETSLVVEAGDVLEVFESITPDAAGKINFHYVVVDFFCRLKSGELCAGADARQALWANKDGLNAFDLTDSTLNVLRKAFSITNF